MHTGNAPTRVRDQAHSPREARIWGKAEQQVVRRDAVRAALPPAWEKKAGPPLRSPRAAQTPASVCRRGSTCHTGGRGGNAGPHG